MITAAEAREKALGSRSVLDNVMKSIEVLSEKGELYINLPHRCLSDEEVSCLRDLGYQIDIDPDKKGQIDVISW